MSLELRAATWKAERRRALALEALARAAGWGLAAAAALAALDRAADLPRPLRVAAWLAGACAFAVHAWRLVGAWRAATTGSVFAAAAAAWPETRPMLSSAWSLRGGAGGARVSAELREEHLRRADALAASLPGTPLFPWTPSRVARYGGRAAAAALLAALVLGARGSWARVLAPWLDAPLDGLVMLLPGDANLDWGASASVSARLTPRGASEGVRPGDLTLETRGADGAWRAVPWDRVDGESASFETGALAAPLDYRARRRGETTGARRLTPIAAPRLKLARAVVHGARGPRSFTLGEDAPVKARRGDWIAVRAEPEAELASVGLRLSSLPAPLPMKLGSDGAWTGGFLAQEDATLSFSLVSADGRRDPSPPAYAVAVAGDAKPVVELLSPQMPLQSGPRETIPIAYSARDDGALTRLELVTRAAGKETRRALPLEKGASEAIGDAPLPLRAWAPGVEVAFWLEAADDASPPQTARSEMGSVEIVDLDAAHAAALAGRERALAALDKAAQAAEDAAKAAEKGDENAAKEAARPLAGRWSAASGELMSWNDALKDDARANPGVTEQAAAAAESLAQAAMEGLPKADAALREKDLPRAAREQRALAEQAKAAAKALRESSAVQNAQDMADRARGAERDAADAAARMAGASPEQLKELAKALDGVQEALEELRKSIDALPEAAPGTAEAKELPLDGARASAQELRRAMQSGDPAAAAKAARELAEKLARLSKGLRESGRKAAAGRSGQAREAAGKVADAWREAVASQETAVEAARRVDSARTVATLKAQKEVLRRVADAIDGVRASSPPPIVLGRVDDASRELAAGRADAGAGHLRAAAALARSAAKLDPARASARETLAKTLDEAAASIERGVPSAAPDPAATRAAADAQTAAKAKAGRLKNEVAAASATLGFAPGGPGRRVEAALAEEAAGEGALRRGESAEGLQRGEAALAILQEGQKDSASGEGSADGMEQGMMRAFEPGGSSGTRRSPRGATGQSLGRVRLPTADEYRPPKELREELERSLREARPAAHDSAIKEYFRRLTR